MSQSATNLKPEQKFVFDHIDRNAKALGTLCDSIFHFAELGMQEFETSKLMTGILEEAGFTVERGICGFPTGFCATYGSGEPVIALHTEYDANPDNSQEAGIAEPKSIVEGAPGHCEGHNVNGAVLVTSALAAKAAIDKFGFKGTIKVFGAPAEEQLVSRPYYVRDGYFDDVDIAFHNHIGGEFRAGYGLMQSALISATFTFHGETAHAGVAPWKGRDALDGVVLMDMGMAQYREHFEPGMMAQRTITHGGDQPNVIPRKAAIWWYFRAPSAELAAKLFERAKKIAEGAALMTNTEVEIDVMAAVWPVRGNRTMAELLQRQMEFIGMPDWTEEEEALARKLQERAKVKIDGLKHQVTLMKGEAQQKSSANDSGDVTWKVPTAKFYFPSNIPNVSNHHWAAGVALATSIAHKGGVAGAKAMAGAIVECLSDPSIVVEAKRSFQAEIADTPYKPLLPLTQKPPLELNRATQEKYRALLAEHYVKERPEFV